MAKRNFLIATTTAIALTLSIPIAFAEPGTNSDQSQVKTLDAKSIADQYLKQNADKYQLPSDLSSLKYVTTIDTPAGSYVRYQQEIQGAPVFTKQVTVTIDRTGTPLLAVSDYVPYSSIEQMKKKISQSEAEAKALSYIGGNDTSKWTPASRQFGYVIENGKAIPSYRVVVRTKTPKDEWDTYIHAGSGKLLKKKNRVQHATGTGTVFNPNPVESKGTTSGLSDNQDKDSAALTSQLKSVILQGLDGSGYLRGQYVTISSKAKTYSATNTFNYTRANDSFEDVMAYYHIDSLQRYIQSLGFNNINNRAIKVNVNGTTADNSYYSPATKSLTFGTGGVDDAEDAGIIAHEYGHSIQDNQVPDWGQSAEGGAMGEGFGDFLGATYEDAMTGNDSYGKACIGEWDAVSYSSTNPPCLRRLDANKVYPRDWAGEVHDDGEIWSQGEYDMAKAFGRDVATKLILQSHWSLTPNATFADGAKAIKQADVMLYNGAHAAQIDAIWAARGIPTN
jgi:Zn-dependent metalloprotease